MKTIKLLSFPFLIVVLFLTSNLFQSCGPDDCEVEEDACDTCIQVFKPNIYIYPENRTDLRITLSFPQGGKIDVSIPEYRNGWDISVDKFGKINNEFDYLFYESSQPDVWQMEKGWCIKMQDLTDFFTNNLTIYGFEGKEIKDFTDYWIPRFITSDYYVIYPQNNEIIDSVIELNISQTPANILRLFYVVQESNNDISNNLEEPSIDSFSRERFFVTEWGVVLK